MENLNNQFRKKYKKAIVTGGAGFIGSHLCERLVKIGVEVISLDNYSAGYHSNIEFLLNKDNFSEFNCEITDKNQLRRYFDGVDIVFHNAAAKKSVCMKDPLRDLFVNALGTYNLLEISKSSNVKKFIHASTGSVYGNPIELPQTEKHPLHPVSLYGITKLAGENYASFFSSEYDMDITILRYFHVYGLRQESNEFGGVIAIFIRNMLEKKMPIIYGDGSQMRSFTDVLDVVDANIMVAVHNKTKGEIYNCASGIKVSINQLCDAIIKYFNKTGQVKPEYRSWMPGDIKIFDVSNDKIRELGMQFRKDFLVRLKELVNKSLG